MKFKQKMYVAFGSVLFLVGAMSYNVTNYLENINSGSTEIVNVRYEKVKHSTRIKTEVNRMGLGLRDIIVNPNPQNIKDYTTLMNESAFIIEEALEYLQAPANREPELHERVLAVNRLFNEYNSFRIRATELIKVGEVDRSKTEFEEGRQARLDLVNRVDEIVAFHEKEMGETLKEVAKEKDKGINQTFLSLLATILVISATNYWIIRSFNNRIDDISFAIEDFDISNLKELPRIDNPRKDEFGQISRAFNTIASALEEQMEKEVKLRKALEEEWWLQATLVDFSDVYQGSKSFQNITRNFINHICPIIGAGYGVFYLINEKEKNKLIKSASYAHDGLDGASLSFRIGEGFVGQCAFNKDIKIVDVPTDYFQAMSGLGSTLPKVLLFRPVVFEGEVLGVVEFALFTELTELQERLVTSVLQTTGVVLSRVRDNIRVEELLAESQLLTEELQTQSEELQTQSEELQSQSEELKAQQEELMISNEKLLEQFKTSEERSKELFEAKRILEEQAEALNETSQYKSEFLANMSHELRTPLNSLLILAQMLVENKEKNLSLDQIEWARTIQMSGKELLKLINEILDLSKLEAGKVELEITHAPLEEIVNFIERIFTPIAQNKNIELLIEVSPDFPAEIITDLEKFKQILKNLISNGFKFTEEGFVAIKFITMEEEGNLAISVTDTGIGIPVDKQEVIFEAFRQADGTTSRKYGGTGLGLSISKDLALLLGGDIVVNSSPGHGSTFSLLLPRNPNKASDVTTSAQKEIGVTQETLLQTGPLIITNEINSDYSNSLSLELDLAGSRVLVVDDDMRNIFALTTALEKVGLEVCHAENGKQAIEKLSGQSKIDLILMDIMMPEMDGYEAIKAIRNMERYKDLPIIALTAKAMKHDREKCIEVGASDYISKPVNLDQLLSLIRVWLFDGMRGNN